MGYVRRFARPLGAAAMRTSYRVFVLAVVFALCAACWSGVNSPAQEKKAKEEKGVGAVVPVPKWEYKVAALESEDKDAEKDLNKLGEEGWELVGAPSIVTSPRQGQGNPGTSTKVKLIFKRPKR
jgi:hypothetical protein